MNKNQNFLVCAVLNQSEGFNFQSIEADWNELYHRLKCSNPFISFDWLATWWSHFGKDYRPWLVTVRDDGGRLLALAPFCLDKRSTWPFQARRLGFMGVGPSDRLDLIVDPVHLKSAMQAMADALIQDHGRWDCLEFSDFDERSAAVKELLEILQCVGLKGRSRIGSVCPYVVLPATFDEFLGGLGKNLRRNYGRRLRSMEEKGIVEFAEVTQPDDLARGFDDLVALHRLRFAQRGDESPFLRKELPFHREFIKSRHGRGCAQLFLLRVEGKAIGAWFGFSQEGVFHSYQSGMDPAWSKLSVGLVTLGSTIQRCIELGLHEVDFLRGAEDYKYQWTSHSRETLSVMIFAGHLRGRLVRTHTSVQSGLAVGIRLLRKIAKSVLQKVGSVKGQPLAAIPSVAEKSNSGAE